MDTIWRGVGRGNGHAASPDGPAHCAGAHQLDDELPMAHLPESVGRTAHIGLPVAEAIVLRARSGTAPGVAAFPSKPSPHRRGSFPLSWTLSIVKFQDV